MVIETDKAIEDAQIRRLLEDWANAIRDKDIDLVMACYAPDIVAFDMIPPLRYEGKEAYRKNWQMGFDCCEGNMDFETHDLELIVGDEVAFSHRLNRIRGKDSDGQEFDNWVRWTACFRKLDGRWLITHEHISVPIDMDSGKGLMDLQP